MVFFAPRSAREGDVVTDVVLVLIRDGGLPALTMRGIARRMRMNPGIVNQWFGGREAMLAEVTGRPEQGPDPMPLGHARHLLTTQVGLIAASQTRRNQSDDGGFGSSASGV